MVRINDMAPVMRAAGNGVELAYMNFSLRPLPEEPLDVERVRDGK